MNSISASLPKSLANLRSSFSEKHGLHECQDDLLALYIHWWHLGVNSVRLPNWRLSNKWRDCLIDSYYLERPKDDNRLFDEQLNIPDILKSQFPFPPANITNFSFIDLFAGVGGFRLALQNLNGKCLFSSEWNEAAKNTYFKNFGELPFGDIRQFTSDKVSDHAIKKCIPKHDILCAGFPCQPFSHAGVSSRTSLGQNHGFDCATQGTLFFDLIRIAKATKPKVLFLENVRNLVSHDKGQTFEIIRKTIEEDLGYSFHYKIVDSRSVVPQKRVRCFMICFRKKSTPFEFPTFDGEAKALESVLQPDHETEAFTITDRMWAGHQRRTATNIARGSGFTTYAAKLNEPANTIVARYWKDGKECLVPQAGKNPRTLTPRECARLQGYPEKYLLPERKKDAYMQMGNSVVVPVVEAIAEQILKSLRITQNEI